MEQMMTLREVCIVTNVSRRAIQGYEKAGLLSCSAKTERGYLLYDKEMQERIKEIKLYQEIGFRIKEIEGIIDSANSVRRQALEQQLVKLEQRREQDEALIETVKELIKQL